MKEVIETLIIDYKAHAIMDYNSKKISFTDFDRVSMANKYLGVYNV
jgi:hypothetical protein